MLYNYNYIPLFKLKESKHCNVCNKCIRETFDHHCFWLNTCIFKENFDKKDIPIQNTNEHGKILKKSSQCGSFTIFKFIVSFAISTTIFSILFTVILLQF
jgi:hypothetical protein